MLNSKWSINKKLAIKIPLSVLLIFIFSCQRIPQPNNKKPVDVVLIGAGIMSATLGSLINQLDSNLTIEIFERLDGVAKESSDGWNNAGTGHASYAELNYTPERDDNSIDITKALAVTEAFEVSKQYWAHLSKKNILDPKQFIHNTPHVAFVWGEDNVDFLQRRHQAMIKYPVFAPMKFSQDKKVLKQWIPLVMQGRDENQAVAATKMPNGVDVDFGTLTRSMMSHLVSQKNINLHTMHEVKDLIHNDDSTWTVVVTDLKNNKDFSVTTKFVFIGAGGGALPLLQKSNIPEGRNYGGFPVGGAWLVTHNEKLVNQHFAKVYGKASVGSPPMSVPHLDKRNIEGKKSLLFGPFATYSTKFLKNGSWLDLPRSVTFGNMIPMLQAGFKNFNLVTYLISQVLMSESQRIESLKEYFPNADEKDWQTQIAGQRVQIIKKHPEKGGVLQFGTELVGSKDGRLVALLGASPGASTAVQIMLDVLKMSFANELETPSWKDKLIKMIPSYGKDLASNKELLDTLQTIYQEHLNLDPLP